MGYNVEEIRKDFEQLKEGNIYLDTAATALKPKVVINAIKEYYIKNDKVYFIYEKMIYKEHSIKVTSTGEASWIENPKILGISEKRYYFDSNGEIVRYIDEKGNIHENDSQMREADKEIRLYKPSFLGNKL